MHKVSFIMAAVLVSSTMCTTTYAESANDLFEKYNKQKQTAITEVESDYKSSIDSYNTAVKDVMISEHYNETLNNASEYQNAVISQLNIDVGVKLKSNVEISDLISQNINGDIDYLLSLDHKYNNNLSDINDMLSTLDSYSLAGGITIGYDRLNEAKDNLTNIKEVYDSAVEVCELGIVNGVRIPLGKDSLVTSNYGSRIDPMTGSSVEFHSGLDLRAAEGTEVLALFNGVVKEVGYSVGAGNYIRIDHGNGIISYCCHLKEVTTSAGQRVSQYDSIALSGNTGTWTTGPHLHLGLYIDGKSVDPGLLFKE